MQRDRNADIKRRQMENKELEEETRRMQAELENLRRIKEEQLVKQLEALKVEEEKQLKKEEEGLAKKEQPSSKSKRQTGKAKPGATKPRPRLQDLVDSSSEEEPSDGENLKYFLSVVGMPQYYERFAANKITGLPQLRNLKEAQLKAMAIPVKDHVKIIKKLREMGF